MKRSEAVEPAGHWVVKIGSAVLLRDDVHVDRPTFVSLVRGIAERLEAGGRVTVVSSGAVALGRRRTGEVADTQAELPRLQALAALGQSELIQMYDAEFGQYGRKVAQILLGRADLDRREGFLNARLTLEAVERMGAVAIVNENDTVATEELRFGDNDELAALVCGLVQADLLVILSDVDGIYDVETVDGARRFTERISRVSCDEPRLDVIAGPSQTAVGRGGMVSKVRAGRVAARYGTPTIVAPGKRTDVLQAIGAGEDVGTLLVPTESQTLQGRKVWLGGGAIAVGKLVCDAGAVRAVVERGASLLPSGIVTVDGDFGEGSVVELTGADGKIFARGLAVYAAADIRKIAGRQSAEIRDVLGFKVLDAVVHRDSLVVL